MTMDYSTNEGGAELRILGNTGIILSSCGFGCAAAWGKSVMGKAMISEQEAQELVETAYKLGVRYFDTGFNYGFSEERLGRILKNTSVFRREDIVISTKFGEEFSDGKWRMNWSADWMRKSIDISMERLGVDYLDMLMCHGGTPECFSEELFDALSELKKKGVVRAIGINTFSTDVIRWVLETKRFDFVMLDYNLLKQEREPLIESLCRSGIGVIAGQPLAESLYSDRVFRIRKRKDLWYLARALVNFRGLLFKGRRYRFINDVPGISGSQIALKYVLDNSNVSSSVFGTTSIAHLKENLAARQIKIPDEIYNRIKTTG